MPKILPENSLPLPTNRQKHEIISLSYDVNDRVYSKSKSIVSSYGFSQQRRRQNLDGFIRIWRELLTNYEVKQILIWSKRGQWWSLTS